VIGEHESTARMGKAWLLGDPRRLVIGRYRLPRDRRFFADSRRLIRAARTSEATKAEVREPANAHAKALGRLTGVDYSEWLNERGRGAFTERQ